MKTEKKKSHPRLPSGFGTIRYLGEGRRRPYAVQPFKQPKALCYVADWYTGLAILAAWHAGIYYSGMELNIELRTIPENVDAWVHIILQKASLKGSSSGKKTASSTFSPTTAAKKELSCMFSDNLQVAVEQHSVQPVQPNCSFSKPTVKEVYEAYYDWKFGMHAARKCSISTERAAYFSFRKLKPIENKKLEDLSITELQDLVNRIQMSRSTVSRVVQLIKQMYRFACSREMCRKDIGQYVILPDTRAETHHQAFTDAELDILWKNRDDPIVRMILIMCYSGFRISAYESLEVNLTKKYFKGGIKTVNGIGRIVPIHSSIQPLVELSTMEGGFFSCMKKETFNRRMQTVLKKLEIDQAGRHHTPHSCRHTFSRLCESFNVNEADRKRMLGHSLRNDITNGVYGHRSLEELRAEIEKIQVKQESG